MASPQTNMAALCVAANFVTPIFSSDREYSSDREQRNVNLDGWPVSKKGKYLAGTCRESNKVQFIFEIGFFGVILFNEVCENVRGKRQIIERQTETD